MVSQWSSQMSKKPDYHLGCFPVSAKQTRPVGPGWAPCCSQSPKVSNAIRSSLRLPEPPTETRRRHSAFPMLGLRLGRWPGIEPALKQRSASVGLAWESDARIWLCLSTGGDFKADRVPLGPRLTLRALEPHWSSHPRQVVNRSSDSRPGVDENYWSILI